MIDFAVKYSVVVLVAWLCTRRVMPRHAGRAHLVWLAVSATPALWMAMQAWRSPLYVVSPRADWSAPIATAPADWLAILYVTVTVAMLGRVLYACWWAERLRRRSGAVTAEETARLRVLAGDDRLVIRDAAIDAPLTIGILRSAVVLPRGWQRHTDDELQAILAHECAHIARRDLAVNLWGLLLEAAVWWHPCTWLITNRLRWFAELASDRQAAEKVSSDAYASILLRLAARWSAAVPSPAPSVMTSSIARRIELIVDDADPAPRSGRALLIAAVCAILFVPIASTVVFTLDRLEGPDHVSLHQQRHQHGHH